MPLGYTPADASLYVPYTGATTNVDLGVHNLTVDTNTLFVNSATHRAGVGTLAPAALLDVNASGTTTAAANAALKLTKSLAVTTNNNQIDTVQFQNLSSGTSAEIRFICAADDNSYMAFTQPSSGNTGTFFGATKSTGSFVFSNGRNMYVGPVSNNDLYFGTNDVTKMVIERGGDVGIGISNPTTRLHIYDALPVINLESSEAYSSPPSAKIAGIFKYNVAGTKTTFGQIVFGKENATDGNTAGFIAFYKKTSGSSSAEAMRLSSVGNLGIGTTDPTGRLHAYCTAFDDTAICERGGQTSNIMWNTLRVLATKTTDMGDGFGVSTVYSIRDNAAVINQIGAIGAVRAGADNTGDLVFSPYAAGTANERMRITSAGNVGIGTTAPGSKLEVRLTGSQYLGIAVSDDGLAHGMTSIVPTNVFGSMEEYSTDYGGFTFRGLTGNSATTPALYMVGYSGHATPTQAPLLLRAGKKSGTTATQLGATEPAIQIDNYTTNMVTILGSGNVGIGVTVPTAVLHLKAGTATASTAPLKLTSGALLATPEEGAIEFLGGKFYITGVAKQKVIDRSGDVKLDTTTVSNTTNETTVYTASIGANALKAGNVLHLDMSGTIDEAAASDEVTIRIKMGGVTLATVVSPSSGITAKCWHITGYATLRTVGATGSMAWHLDMNADTGTTEACGINVVDTTVAEDVTVTAQWNAAKAGNIFTCAQGIMEYKN